MCCIRVFIVLCISNSLISFQEVVLFQVMLFNNSNMVIQSSLCLLLKTQNDLVRVLFTIMFNLLLSSNLKINEGCYLKKCIFTIMFRCFTSLKLTRVTNQGFGKPLHVSGVFLPLVVSFLIYESMYSIMDQIKFLKGCLPQVFFGPFLNTLTHMSTVVGLLNR